MSNQVTIMMIIALTVIAKLTAILLMINHISNIDGNNKIDNINNSSISKNKRSNDDDDKMM